MGFVMEQFFQFWTFVLVAAYGIRALIIQIRSWLTGKNVSDL